MRGNLEMPEENDSPHNNLMHRIIESYAEKLAVFKINEFQRIMGEALRNGKTFQLISFENENPEVFGDAPRIEAILSDGVIYWVDYYLKDNSTPTTPMVDFVMGVKSIDRFQNGKDIIQA